MDALIYLPPSDADLEKAGLLGDGVSKFTKETIETMRMYPRILPLTLFAVQCVEYTSQLRSPLSTAFPPALSSAPLATEPAATVPYAVSNYEKAAYYNGVTGNGDHPILVYRSDYAINPFPRPQGRFGHLPSKSVQEVYGTSLNPVWDAVGPQIRDVVKALGVRPFSVDPARFISYGDDDAKTLGPPVVLVGVPPSSIDSAAAHAASQRILALLAENGAPDVVVEWREVVLCRMVGPALMDVVGDNNPTAHVRRPFTCALNVPLATREREEDDSQGSLTLYFHENKDGRGQPSTAVLAISNSHVLRMNTKVDYRFRGAGAAKQFVRGIGTRRFQQAFSDIKSRTGDRTIVAGYYTRKIGRLEAIEARNDDQEDELDESRANLNKEKKALTALETFYNEVKSRWSDISDRDIGFLRITKAIAVNVEDGPHYTEDWGAFQLDEAKFKPSFKGTVVDLGTEMSVNQVTAMFYPQSNPRTVFKYPGGRMYEIERVAPPDLLADPDLFDNEGRPCLIVGKDGTKTGLTFGRYAGLESYLCDHLGVESIELGIYNWGKNSPVFSDKGDSGALIWDGNHCAVGQLHSSMSKGGSSNSHVTYATPAWWLVERIKREFPHAVFFHKTWSV